MSHPTHDPFGGNSFGGDPFGDTSFGQAPQNGPPVFTGGPPHPDTRRPQTNTLATLSVIFAIVFAPAGAVLGHLGLAEIKRTGQPGRDRAVIGLALSYGIIALTAVALTVKLVSAPDDHARIGAPPPTQGVTPAAPALTSAAPPAPAVPTVAPTDLAGILPGLEELKALTDNASLTAGATYTAPTALNTGSVSRPECASTMTVGDPSVYTATAPSGFLVARYIAHEFHGMDAVVDEDQSAAAYPNAAAAQAAANHILETWRGCAGSSMTQTTGNSSTPVTVGATADAGHGITTLTVRGGTATMPMFFHRALAAKANIVADVWVASITTDRTAAAVAIANAIMSKIPG